uniref:Uncharacterized protein n=1 Tax=Magallana gigas TaxID=29159 RepID=K1PRA1_MAGGI
MSSTVSKEVERNTRSQSEVETRDAIYGIITGELARRLCQEQLMSLLAPL